MSKNNSTKRIQNLINLKLIIIFVVVAATVFPCIILNFVIGFSYSNYSMKTLINELKNECRVIAPDIYNTDYLNGVIKENIDTEIQQFAYNYSARIRIINKDLTVVMDNYDTDEGKTLVTSNLIKVLKGKNYTQYDRKKGTAAIAVPIYGVNSDVAGIIYVNFTNEELIDSMEYLKKVVLSIETGLILLEMGIGVAVAVILASPAKKMRRNILNIAGGAKGTRITETTIYEYRQIADSVNKMLDKLELIDNSRDEFVSNVSHELKTPMTSMKVLADSLLSQENVPEEIYRDFMEDIVSEIDRENKIIGDLLTLVKTDQTSVPLNIATVNVNDMMELVLKRLKPIAIEKKVELIFESIRPVAAQIDEVKFALVVTNLVENAIKYNVENGWVKASVNADHKFFYINVADSGIGIPQECKDSVFERFYRVDKARSRETGGTGLGLAITRNIVLMHKGTIKFYSKENEGTSFTVRVPLNYVGGTSE